MHELDSDFFKKPLEQNLDNDNDTFGLSSETDNIYFNPILYTPQNSSSSNNITKRDEWLSLFKNIHIAIS